MLVENRRFQPTLLYLYLAPPLEMTQLEFQRDLWHQKSSEVRVLSCGGVCVILRLAFWYIAGL